MERMLTKNTKEKKNMEPKTIPVSITKVSAFTIVIAALLIKRVINVIDRRVNSKYYETQAVVRVAEALMNFCKDEDTTSEEESLEEENEEES